jgi:hypothetical protein
MYEFEPPALTRTHVDRKKKIIFEVIDFLELEINKLNTKSILLYPPQYKNCIQNILKYQGRNKSLGEPTFLSEGTIKMGPEDMGCRIYSFGYRYT